MQDEKCGKLTFIRLMVDKIHNVEICAICRHAGVAVVVWTSHAQVTRTRSTGAYPSQLVLERHVSSYLDASKLISVLLPTLCL